MMLNISFVRRFILIVFMSILLSVFFTPVSNISLAQTATDASVTNSTHTNFLTYEDTTRGFKMQYPSDWNKTDFPPTIPFIFFISPAQNATDNLFESLGVIIELLPMQNITLDQYSLGVIEQLGLESQDFNVTSPPKETTLGGVPAYNMTYTIMRADEKDPSTIHEVMGIVTWAVKDGQAYTILYAGTESQFNYSLHKAQKMIDSFSFIPPQQISISKSPKTELDDATTSGQTGNNFLTYFNSTYGVEIGYPQSWNVSEYTTADIANSYGIAYIFPNSENEKLLYILTPNVYHIRKSLWMTILIQGWIS